MITRNPAYDCEIIVKLKIKNMIDDEGLFDDFDGDAIKCVKSLLDSDSILGICEDDYDIIAATLIPLKD